NIILDEISALRDEIAIIKQADDAKNMADELADIKDKLTNLAIDEREQNEARFKKMHEEIEKLAKQAQREENDSILSDLAELKEAVANQRDADAATLNYMSELAKLLEQHGETHAENSRLADEIENLKSEIASSLAATSVSDTVAELASDIADLKDALRRGAGESFVVDNVPVLEEIEALKAELARKKPRNDNKQVLNEIARLKEEIGAMIEGTPVESEEPAATKPAPRKNTRKKKAAEKPEPQELSSDELISKINNTSINNPVSSTAANEEVILMNPNEAQDIPATSEEMEIASRLAKQVANKLIMEQLVQQLDGSVPRSEVEEIVKDIMPQEFTTIQIDEQSDKVRRLANSLVLDKLRSRLTDKK
ncbi:MAG: hypothetical protein K2M95_05040, partial [Clostridiales bacterium]|nr:hypothetical protein [Clostridiales bacterium]